MSPKEPKKTSEDQAKSLSLFVSEENQGIRLDQFLTLQNEVSSRSRAAWLIANGFVNPLSPMKIKPSTLVQVGDKFTLEFPENSPSLLTPFEFPLDVLFEDSSLIVVNKPAGMVVHPSAGHDEKTLVHALLNHTQDLSVGFEEHRPGIVHRIDKDTSGLLVVAKTDLAHLSLSQQFKEKSAHRVYWAFVFGRPPEIHGKIASHFVRHPTQRKKYASTESLGLSAEKGKRAVTNYKVIESHKNGISLVACKLETGRTHQIRVHLSELGHPIVGDLIYGTKRRTQGLPTNLRNQVLKMNRIALHAAELGFHHPQTKKELRFKQIWPDDLFFLKNLFPENLQDLQKPFS